VTGWGAAARVFADEPALTGAHQVDHVARLARVATRTQVTARSSGVAFVSLVGCLPLGRVGVTLHPWVALDDPPSGRQTMKTTHWTMAPLGALAVTVAILLAGCGGGPNAAPSTSPATASAEASVAAMPSPEASPASSTPASEDSVSPDSSEIQAKGAVTGGGTVLVVDDSRTGRLIVCRQLKSLGFGCAEASDGLQGLAAAGQGGYVAIITDWYMPNLGGLDMTRQLRAQGVTTPIIAVVDATLPDIQEAVSAGMSDVLLKPFPTEVLRSALQQVLAASASG